MSVSVSEFEFEFVFEGEWRERDPCSETKSNGRPITCVPKLDHHRLDAFSGGSGGFSFVGDAIARRIPSGFGTLADRSGTALNRIPRDQHALPHSSLEHEHELELEHGHAHAHALEHVTSPRFRQM